MQPDSAVDNPAKRWDAESSKARCANTGLAARTDEVLVISADGARLDRHSGLKDCRFARGIQVALRGATDDFGRPVGGAIRSQQESGMTLVHFDPEIFILDTLALSADERGALITLLATAWMRGRPVEDDDRVIARVVGVTVPRWRNHIKPAIAPFFDLSNGSWNPTSQFRVERSRLPSGEWTALRAFIFDRDHNTCQYCGTVGGRLEVDHVIPVSRGGTNTPSNLATACHDCNRDKGALTLEEWRGRP